MAHFALFDCTSRYLTALRVKRKQREVWVNDAKCHQYGGEGIVIAHYVFPKSSFDVTHGRSTEAGAAPTCLSMTSPRTTSKRVGIANTSNR